MRAKPKSELECFVLGLVWQLGPVSAYSVRTHMQKSPSTQWSGSAGAIYPLLRRLQSGRLVTGLRDKVGRRSRMRYRITAAGLNALRQWIGPPLRGDVVTVTYDPLRTRARFLAALPPARQREWFAAAIATLDEVEKRVRTWHALHAGGGNPYLVLLTLHGELDVQARRKWLEQVGRLLSTRD